MGKAFRRNDDYAKVRIREDKEGGEIITGQVLCGNNGDGSPHREDKGGEIVTGQVLRGNNEDGSPHPWGLAREGGWVPAFETFHNCETEQIVM